MHIKQIIISNFRSFKSQPEVQPFSQGTNAVVGRNGAGKSNLFDAVQFALLSPKFWTLRTEDRQALLHEGSGSAAVSAYVEIIFDNRDGRFQGFSGNQSDEIVLRRTVGSKKDEIFLQRKKTSKSEVMSLLEGAGFSKSNPYFIVQQGKVNALCVMKDEERLELLKEVAGTTVYDEKKAESEKKMIENNNSMEKIQETLKFMEERLEELRGEKEELTIYQELDRERKALAYTLYDKELRRARECLDEIEHKKAEEAEKRIMVYEQARNLENEITTIEANLKTKTRALKRNKLSIQELEEERGEAITLQTKLELQYRELEESVKTGEANLIKNKEELKQLNIKIQETKGELDTTIQPKFDTAKESLTKMTVDRDAAKKTMDALYAKQGRGRQFEDKEARDKYLQLQIDELMSAKEDKENFLNDQQDSLANARRAIIDLEKGLGKKKENLAKEEKVLEDLSKSLTEKKRERQDMAEKRRAHQSEYNDLSSKVSDARDSQRKAYSSLRKTMPRNTAMGLDALNRIVQEEDIRVGEQYFGPIMDNIELKQDKYQVAVERSADNALFHVIVDTDATAARLMKRLENDRLGRVTFLPLNQLRISNVKYPESRDIVPLLSTCINYDRRLERAMTHVFGKKLLANSVEVASAWSARCDMDAVTLQGDLCSRKGSLSGGFIDRTKSKLKANIELKEAGRIVRKLEADEREMKKQSGEFDKQITKTMSEMQRLEAKKANLEHSLTRADEEIASQESQLLSKKKHVNKLENDQIPPVERQIESITNQIETLKNELGTELSETLTKDEKKLLQDLKSNLSSLEEKIETQTQTLEDISIQRQRLHSLLQDNLYKRKSELEREGVDASNRRRSSGGNQQAARIAQAQRKETLEQLHRELDEATQNSNDIDHRLAELKEVESNLCQELLKGKKQLDSAKAKDNEIAKQLEDAEKREQKLMGKRMTAVQQRETHSRRIKELGTLPSTSELQKHSSYSISALMRELEKTNKKLKSYSHVNKKAFDQFVNFNEQRETLLKRKDEVDKGARKVKELIESLDRQKDEAINRTFRGVSAHFKDVFKELVPNGAGELIMKTSMDEDNEGDESANPDDSDSEEERSKKRRRLQSPSVNRYKGIGIKVRFSEVGENYMMTQLSGGQKSLVAMALIFAIQRCDPAPFYLFDELDQALDSTYRKAVAGLIQRQANSKDNPTQFICSTFRPELVAISDDCYGISHQDKVSNIYHLTKKDALKFIGNLMKEDEAVGDVTSLATS